MHFSMPRAFNQKIKRIPKFCFSCGVIRHGKLGCRKKSNHCTSGTEMEYPYGQWLRVNYPTRRGGSDEQFGGEKTGRGTSFRPFKGSSSSVEGGFEHHAKGGLFSGEGGGGHGSRNPEFPSVTAVSPSLENCLTLRDGHNEKDLPPQRQNVTLGISATIYGDSREAGVMQTLAGSTTSKLASIGEMEGHTVLQEGLSRCDLGMSKSPKGKDIMDSSSKDSGVANFGKTNWKATEVSMVHNMEYLGSDGDMGGSPALQNGKPRNEVGNKVATAQQETVDSVPEASSGDKSGKLPTKFVGSWDSTKGRMEWIKVDQLVRDPFSTSYLPHVSCPPTKMSTNQQVDGSCTLQKLESPSLIQPPSEQSRSEQKIRS
jgi:hypothetical protein